MSAVNRERRGNQVFDREACLAVFSDGFISEHFPELPNRLSTSQEVYRGQFKFIKGKCDKYMDVIKQLDFLVDDFLDIPQDWETYYNTVPLHKHRLQFRTLQPIWNIYYDLKKLKVKFEGYEEISQVLSEYWSLKEEDLPKAIKQVEQLKQVVEQKKQDLALFKKHQSKGGKGKGKRLDKNVRKEIKSLETQVKMAQAEVTSAEKPLSSIYNRIVELKKEAGDRELPLQSGWEEAVSQSYDHFCQLSSSLPREIRNVQYLLDSSNPVQKLALASVTQKDLDKEKDKCPVCWRDYSVGESVRVCGQCNQYFCEPCMEQWLETHTTCPLCKQNP